MEYLQESAAPNQNQEEEKQLVNDEKIDFESFVKRLEARVKYKEYNEIMKDTNGFKAFKIKVVAQPTLLENIKKPIDIVFLFSEPLIDKYDKPAKPV